MPEQDYKYIASSDMYSSRYEQYYFKQTSPQRVRPLRTSYRRPVKKRTNILSKLLTTAFCALLFFVVLPYSFNNYISTTFPQSTKKMLRVDYNKLLYPTNSYLYKDLFLGKYVIKDTQYKKTLMVDVKETHELFGLKNRLLQLSSMYNNVHPSVYVFDYSTNGYVDINADESFSAASIIKIPVLIEMFRQIEAGKFSLSDTMVLEDYYRAPGSGKLQYSQGGIAHSMDYLAKVMIENSDNSSTNMIMAKMGGMPDVNRAIKSWGLKSTHISNWLPDMDGTNVTTTRELGKMFYNMDTTTILSIESKQHIADYLSHVKNNRLLQAGIPDNATLLHKTGDIGYVLGDAGIVKTASGKKYIVAILAKRPYNNQKGKEFIVEASKIIYNSLN